METEGTSIFIDGKLLEDKAGMNGMAEVQPLLRNYLILIAMNEDIKEEVDALQSCSYSC